MAFPSRPLRHFTYAGDRYPMHCASPGKAIAAHLRDGELAGLFESDELPPRTEKSLTSLAAFRAELPAIREQGYALDDEETVQGVRCVGAVVRDYTGRPVAAISASGAAAELVDETLEACIERVQHGARALSEALGYVATA